MNEKLFTKNGELTETALDRGHTQQSLTRNERFRVTISQTPDLSYRVTVTDLTLNQSTHDDLSILTDARRTARLALRDLAYATALPTHPHNYVSHRSLNNIANS